MSLNVERDGAVLRLTIDRQDRMNAVDLATMGQLADAIGENDPATRVIVITGAGKAFCTGADLAAAATGGQGGTPDVVMDTANSVIRAVIDSPVPVIARVNGPAAGVGASLALAADLVYAADDTYLLLPFTNIGLLPDGGATAIVASAMGRARAMAMALLGERLPTTDAAAAGLITAAVPAGELDTRVEEVATKLANGPRRALELTKRAINAATLGHLDEAMAREKTDQIELLTSPDFIEGVTAMLTRRSPRFGA